MFAIPRNDHNFMLSLRRSRLGSERDVEKGSIKSKTVHTGVVEVVVRFGIVVLSFGAPVPWVRRHCELLESEQISINGENMFYLRLRTFSPFPGSRLES